MRALLTFILAGCGPTNEQASDDDGLLQQDIQDDAETDGDANDVDDQSTYDCENEFGTVTGRVLYDLEQMGQTRMAPGASVIATPTNGDNITIRSDAEGAFTAPLPADEYLLMANDTDGCVSDQASMRLVPCDTFSITLRLTECLDGLNENGFSG